MKATWVKVLEYASKPLQGTMSRKLRKGNINTYYDFNHIAAMTTYSASE
jgi:hypothetical protein